MPRRGKCASEMFTFAHRPQPVHGGSNGISIGYRAWCCSCTARAPIVVLDGDGAALIRLGAMATIGAAAPANLIHVVLDNSMHDSTGGQRTVSDAIDFCGVAVSCGYAKSVVVPTSRPKGSGPPSISRCGSRGHTCCTHISRGSIGNRAAQTCHPRGGRPFRPFCKGRSALMDR